MQNKVILILVDGMKGDSVLNCKNNFAKMCADTYACKLDAQTMAPSSTLPCHMSLFLSVPPLRHGVLTNTYVPQVRPVASLFNVLHGAGKKSAMFYNWEELRDLSSPGELSHSLYIKDEMFGDTGDVLTQSALAYIDKKSPDFVFLYLGCSDFIGHKYGWDSAEYTKAISDSFDCINKVYDKAGEAYTIIITSDHGGHDRTHGTEMPEDMTIPVILISDYFKANKKLPSSVSILDIAPTIASMLNLPCNEEWEGKSLV